MTFAKYIFDMSGLQNLLEAVAESGYQTIGPVIEDGAIVYNPLTSIDDLPRGYEDEQSGGHYRLTKIAEEGALQQSCFRTVVGPQSWKRYLFPSAQKMWSANRNEKNWQIEEQKLEKPNYAFFGVRPCEIAAIEIQDRVFDNGDHSDSRYKANRQNVLIIAVNCTRAASTCFCTSMNGGPKAQNGFDLSLTELIDDTRHLFVVEVGSERGGELIAKLNVREASHDEIIEGENIVSATATAMERQMPENARQILLDNLEHPHWQDVAKRCLNCANCTMVCPTCFCSTMEDVTSLDGQHAERWRKWDSCFTVDFSYIHGGPLRREGSSRYRQWITHKLANWQDQFGTSGCTGCGRCITWCPVGIDIRKEVVALEMSAAAAG
jgi:ferredoxin